MTEDQVKFDPNMSCLANNNDLKILEFIYNEKTVTVYEIYKKLHIPEKTAYRYIRKYADYNLILWYRKNGKPAVSLNPVAEKKIWDFILLFKLG